MKNLLYIIDITVPIVFGLGLLYFCSLWLIGVLQLRGILNTAIPCTNTLIPKGVQLLASERIETPFVCYTFRSFLKPTIVVPANMSQTSLRFALVHELSHIKNGDLLCWRALNLFAPLFWIQPFYKILCNQLRLDQDYLADLAASQIAETPEDYASELLAFAKLRKLSLFPTTLSMGDSPTLLHRRIEMIIKNDRSPLRTRPRRLMMCAFVALLGPIVVILGTVRLTAQDAALADSKARTADTKINNQPDTTLDSLPDANNSEKEETVELIFTAVDEEGNPVPNTLVGLRYSDWENPIEKQWTTDANGCLKITIPVSIIDNHGRFEAYNRERGLLAKAEFPYEKTGITNPVNVKCVLKKSRKITGTVVDTNDQPVKDATVSGSAWGALRIACTTTDENGRFEYDASSEFPISSIFAMKPGVGYDAIPLIANQYEYSNIANDPNWKNENHDNGPFNLKLEKREPITVRVIDEYRRPLEGIMVTPQVRSQGFESNGFESLLGQKTNADGIVVFDWFPSRSGQVVFTANGANPRFEKSDKEEYFGRENSNWYSGQPNETLEITLPKRVTVNGSVRLEDGTPVPWCRLLIITGKMATVGESTDHNGNFSYDVNEGDNIIILPDDSEQPLVAAKKWIDRVQQPRDSEKLPTFDFVLKKGTKLSGKLISPQDQKPIPDGYLWISELKGAGELMPQTSFHERHIRADNNGNYSISLPPGLYQAQNQDRTVVKNFEVKNEEEILLDF
ncbi:MAG: M56 family metallopeptidase [Thermoguttaceae bacterium]